MEPLQRTKQNPMATASFFLGVTAIGLSFLIPVYALLCGSLSILFAILSRGSGFRMPDKAIAGFIASAFAIVIAILLSIAVLYMQQFLTQKFGADILDDPAAMQKMLNELMQNYKDSLQTGGSGL